MSRRVTPGRLLMATLKIGAVSLIVGLTLRLGSQGSYSAVQSQVSGVAFQTESLCPGDSNVDGVRDVRDLVLIQSHILNLRALQAQALMNADTNQDAQIDVRDIVALIRHQLERRHWPSVKSAFPTSLRRFDSSRRVPARLEPRSR